MGGPRWLLLLLALAGLAALVAYINFVPLPKSSISVNPNVPENPGEAARIPPSAPARTEAPSKK